MCRLDADQQPFRSTRAAQAGGHRPAHGLLKQAAIGQHTGCSSRRPAHIGSSSSCCLAHAGVIAWATCVGGTGHVRALLCCAPRTRSSKLCAMPGSGSSPLILRFQTQPLRPRMQIQPITPQDPDPAPKIPESRSIPLKPRIRIQPTTPQDPDPAP